MCGKKRAIRKKTSLSQQLAQDYFDEKFEYISDQINSNQKALAHLRRYLSKDEHLWEIG